MIRKQWYIEYVKDCMEDVSFQPSLTQNDWINCQTEQKLTSYDRCLLENGLHRESMIPTLECYYKKGHVEGRSVIQLSKVEAPNTRNSTPEVYSVLMNCKTNNNASDLISMKNCLSQNANVIYLSKDKSTTADGEEVSKKCSFLASDVDLKDFQVSNKFNINIVPYLKCVQENLNIIQDGCLYVANFLEKYGEVYKELVTKCFIEGADADDFDYVKFYECYYN